MASQEHGVDIKFLVTTLRHVTTAVQVLPFIYVGLYIVSLGLYTVTSEKVQVIIDSLIYVSPLMVLAFLILSRVLRLCKWHRTACILPLVPQAVNLIDYYVVSMAEVSAFVFNSMIIFMAGMLLIAAYNVFVK